MSVAGQTSITYGYDNANRLTQIQQGTSATVTIAPDADGRRQSVTLPNGVSMNYGYDVASQLTGITYKLGANTLGNLIYGYDLAGRRTAVGGSYARTNVPAAASAASYNVNNQLTNWKGATLTYDLNGNLTSDGTNTYTWNARNQLVTISGVVNANFQYDAFGRRVSKTVGGTTQFLYDGANPVQEISGSSAPANLITGGVDEYFLRADSAGARSFMTDALGSTLALADSTGTLQTQYTFEPFGNTAVTGSSTTNSFAFTGREFDSAGLYYYRARYYSPGFQRFVSEDPFGFLDGKSNLYSYAFNSPLNYRDPSGRCPMCIILLIGAGFGGGVEGYKAYERGCRGWDLVEAVGRGAGAGAGLLAAGAGLLTGGIATEVLGGSELAAIGAGTIGGGSGGFVNAVSNEAIESGLHQGQIILNPDEIGESTLLGAVAGGAAVRLGPVVNGGQNFNPRTSPETFGPRANQAYGQAAIGGAIGAIPDIGRAALNGRKDACHQ